MNDFRPKLIDAASAVCGPFGLRKDFSAGSVGAAILTTQGNIYTGICIDLACGLGFCAEVAAVAEMLKARETHALAMVAMSKRGVPVAPCGRCREMMAQIDSQNLECVIILGENRDVPLSKLLPEHWLAGQ
jgi:cytidine deaminase